MDTGYLDAIAKESASEECVRCAGTHRWRTAALVYERPEWDYYYCYECRRWYKRHYGLRYIVVNVDDRKLVRSLASQVSFGYDMMTEPAKNFSWLRAKLSRLLKRRS